jgi:hypothetical protein
LLFFVFGCNESGSVLDAVSYYKELVNDFFLVLLSFWSSNCKNSIQMPHPWLGQLVPLKIETLMKRLNAGLHFYGCF